MTYRLLAFQTHVYQQSSANTPSLWPFVQSLCQVQKHASLAQPNSVSIHVHYLSPFEAQSRFLAGLQCRLLIYLVSASISSASMSFSYSRSICIQEDDQDKLLASPPSSR